MSNGLKKLASVAGRLLLAYLLVFSQSVQAGQDREVKVNPKSLQNAAPQQGEKPPSAGAAAKAQTQEIQGDERENAVEQEKTAAGDGKHDGIKVHGHWTIEVRNPDRTLVTHREFENSLVSSPLLSSLLSRTNSVGYWTIQISGGVGGSGICSFNGTASDCVIAEAGQGAQSSPFEFNTLVVSTGGTNGLVLNGTLIASLTGTISRVETNLVACPATFPVSSPCTTGGSVFGFTDAVLSTPIQVSAGQTAAVTVNISFS
jgi:hypothetical protein